MLCSGVNFCGRAAGAGAAEPPLLPEPGKQCPATGHCKHSPAVNPKLFLCRCLLQGCHHFEAAMNITVQAGRICLPHLAPHTSRQHPGVLELLLGSRYRTCWAQHCALLPALLTQEGSPTLPAVLLAFPPSSPVRSSSRGPGAVAQTKVSLVTTTFGALGSRDKRKSC